MLDVAFILNYFRIPYTVAKSLGVRVLRVLDRFLFIEDTRWMPVLDILDRLALALSSRELRVKDMV